MKDDILAVVDETVDLITVTPEGFASSRERAGRFLVVQAILVTYLKEVDEELAKRITLKEATFSNTIANSEGKSITEKKINVAKNREYSSIRESYEELEAEREWVKGHIKIFENAHLLYRSMARE